MGLIPRLGRSPGEGNDNPLQYSCLENPMDRGAWKPTIHGVTRVGHDLATKHIITLKSLPCDTKIPYSKKQLLQLLNLKYFT